MANNSAAGIRWDLSDLFAAHDDEKIATTLNDCRTRALEFAERYRPALENPPTLSAATLFDALQELAVIYESLGRVGSYGGWFQFYLCGLDIQLGTGAKDAPQLNLPTMPTINQPLYTNTAPRCHGKAR